MTEMEQGYTSHEMYDENEKIGREMIYLKEGEAGDDEMCYVA